MIRYLLTILIVLGMVCPVIAASGAATGDLLKVDYTITTTDGQLVRSTRAEVANDAKRTRHIGYSAPAKFGSAEMVPGAPDLLLGISNALIGMEPGAKKVVQLAPEQAFGISNPALAMKLPLERRIPRNITLPPDEYLKRFMTFPVVGKNVPLTPWIPAQVKEVTERAVKLELQLPKQERFEEPFGYMTIKADEKNVVLTLHPRIGAEFILEDKPGRISSVEKDSFTVDRNHPLAGVTLQLEIELVSLTPKAELPKGEPAWKAEHDTALESAKKVGRPALLLLYADWCSWCKKLQNETFVDPRITVRRDRLDWIKVNADKEKSYMEKYGQKGFPLVLLFNGDGSIRERIDGYADAERMAYLLDQLTAAPAQGK
jgi:FKBP-type peptidyl-prolyl cis-trans isomerase 2